MPRMQVRKGQRSLLLGIGGHVGWGGRTATCCLIQHSSPMILYLYLYPLFMSHDLAVAIDLGANFKDWNDLIYHS